LISSSEKVISPPLRRFDVIHFRRCIRHELVRPGQLVGEGLQRLSERSCVSVRRLAVHDEQKKLFPEAENLFGGDTLLGFLRGRRSPKQIQQSTGRPMGVE